MFKRLILFGMMIVLFFAVQTGRANANIVTNGDFATGDFGGWALGGDTANALYWVNTADSISSVNYAQFFTYDAPVTMAQTLTTNPGQAYTVSFSLYNSATSPSGESTYNEFMVLWDGNLIEPLHLVNASAFDWTTYRFDVTGTGSDTLTFSFQQDGSNFNITNVVAAPVPVPAALLLLGPGLAGLAIVRRRITK